MARRAGRLLLGSVWAGAFTCGAAALQWEAHEGYRSARLPPLAPGRTGFTQVPAERAGVAFTNHLSEARIMANANLLNGSGVALGDFDGDGRCDIYFCDLSGRNALFRNMGNWKFVNVTESAGVACAGQTSTGAVFADVNGDSRMDLLVASMGGPNACFLNDGQGGFTNVTAAAGLASRLGSTSMALADIDGNGTLDLYVANYGVTSLLRSGGALSFRMVNGKPVVTGRHANRIKIIGGVMYELGEPDAVYLNDGQGRFRPVSWTDGTFLDDAGEALAKPPWDQGLAVLLRDFNGDRHPDIYVCNDASTPDYFWVNDGRGRFRAVHPFAQRQTSYYAMCVDAADLDRDGRDEFLVIDMLSRDHRLVMTQMSEMHPQPRRIGEFADQPQVRRNTFYHARADGTYAEIAHYAGLAASDWSWAAIFLDVDLDGWEDALIANGFAYDMDDLDTRDRLRNMGPLSISESRRKVLLYPALKTPNAAFSNQRDLTFREMGKDWGFDSKEVSNGMAVADLDNDGDLDVVINCFNAPPLLYRNETGASRVGVRLKGKGPNTQGIGARITVLGGPVTQSQEVICGGRYMSGDDPMRVFAAGGSTNLSIEVAWRNGQKSVLSGLRGNYLYEIAEGAAQSSPAPKAAEVVAPIFEDVSELILHTHPEAPYDDAARQPMLSRLFSQPGPGVAWHDWDNDGFDDLILGSGRGGALALFRNDGKGGFTRVSKTAVDSPAPDDLGGIAGMRTASGQTTILAALGNYEAPSRDLPSVLRYDWVSSGFAAGTHLPASEASSGALALGDIDGDGQLDLFVGGRMLAGRYPEPASSRVYRNQGGQFRLDEEWSSALQHAGLVNGAVFTDLNEDGRADLVLACDWAPPRVFMNESGRLAEATERLGFTKHKGWWNGVTTGDFDGDGRMDIVASNWGRNTRYEQHRARPLRLYYGDLDGNGSTDLIEAYFNTAMGKVVPEHPLDTMARGLPALRERFKTHRAYAEASVEEIFGAALSSAKLLEANWLETTVFLNRGDQFEARPLPREAQFSPAFGVSVGDMDGDGKEDIFLAQNFSALYDTSRYDAGRGLWLRGDGTGHFAPVRGQESGVKVYGEQRGCALADYDRDGRVDLVVTQNGAATKLYHNVGARPGYRVRLKGPEANPTGVGAVIRLFFGERAGPAREIHAGSGYWSQDSAVQVMGGTEVATRVSVRWPGGKTVTANLPPSRREVEVAFGE